MTLSILFAVAAVATPSDTAFGSFDATNPAVGTLGDWSYGSLAGGTFAALPNLVVDAPHQLTSWQDSATGKPKITHNDSVSLKTVTSVRYPSADFLVVRPKTGTPATIRFTASADGVYTFDATFQSMRTVKSASTVVSAQVDGVTVGGCSGRADGLYPAAGLTCAAFDVGLLTGESIDFVVDADGGTDAQDDVGVSVTVQFSADSDADGLSDTQEAGLGTNPNVSDTDGDGLADGYEFHVVGTSPVLTDTDGDLLADGLEDPDGDGLDNLDESAFGTDPLDADSDDDGLDDGAEDAAGTDPYDTDSDDDTLTDGDEVDLYGTDPTLADTDGGGVGDAVELGRDTDPLVASDDVYGDSAEDAFSGVNPSAGGLGDWSYGYYAPAFTLLPDLVTNTSTKLTSWQITASSAKPRITDNYATTDKTVTSVKYPAEDFLVLKPKNTNAAVLRFTADVGGQFVFDTKFLSARTSVASSTTASVQQDGVTLGACTGQVNGLVTDLGGNVLECDVSVWLDAGDAVDFVVDARGASDATDDVGLRVRVYADLDVDADGLAATTEAALGTDPALSDTDGDGLGDGDEVNTSATDPLDTDSDDDTLTDGEEVNTYGTDPNLADSDSDGLDDADEIVWGTDPVDADSEDDGLDDGDEWTLGTDPALTDTDDDGMTDGDEYHTYGCDPLSFDSDNDFLTDGDEVILGTDPTNEDSDGDGELDGDEVSWYGTDPTDPDSDDDGLDDGDELQLYGTDPNDTDTDGGGVDDGTEVGIGGDPRDPSDD
ncbi:MAG: hypothetical protein ABMB14_18500 [Myxococcota bacterium]